MRHPTLPTDRKSDPGGQVAGRQICFNENVARRVWRRLLAIVAGEARADNAGTLFNATEKYRRPPLFSIWTDGRAIQDAEDAIVPVMSVRKPVRRSAAETMIAGIGTTGPARRPTRPIPTVMRPASPGGSRADHRAMQARSADMSIAIPAIGGLPRWTGCRGKPIRRQTANLPAAPEKAGAKAPQALLGCERGDDDGRKRMAGNPGGAGIRDTTRDASR